MIVDANVYLSRWPCRRLPQDDTAALVRALRAGGINSAWAGSFDALLHRDVAAVNARVAEECRAAGDGVLVPVGCVDPTLPDWQEDLRRCREVHGMRIVRLHPNYHGYELTDPRLAELLTLAEAAGLIVQLAVRMEDPRTQHPRLAVPDVDLAALPEVLAGRRLPVVLLNLPRGSSPSSAVGKLVDLPNVYLDVGMQEGIGGVERLTRVLPYERVLFGSYAPFFVLDSALGKLEESELGMTVRQAIERENALRLLRESAAR